MREIACMIKIGIIGVGHLGKIHLKCLLDIPDFEIVGFYDINPEVTESVKKEFGIHAFSSAEELIQNAEAVDIVTPTLTHFHIAASALRASRHVFIEKPLVSSSSELEKLAVFAHEANSVIQVGHVERFNPALLAAIPFIEKPVHISALRTSSFNSRGTEVSVVLDLMIHDIEIVQHIIKANIRKIYANGLSILSDSIDTATARIEFDNGSSADFFASRIAQQAERFTNVYGRNSQIKVDYLSKTAELVKFPANDKERIVQPYTGQVLWNLKNPGVQSLPVKDHNAITEELKCFARSISSGNSVAVSFSDGYSALETALKINEKINESMKRII